MNIINTYKKAKEYDYLLRILKKLCPEPIVCKGKDCICYCIGLDGEAKCALTLVIDKYQKEELL